MPSSPPNRDLLLQLSAQLTEMQKTIEKVNYQLITSKSDINEIKHFIKEAKRNHRLRVK